MLGMGNSVCWVWETVCDAYGKQCVLGIGSSVCWYGHMLRKEDDHVLRMALEFEVEDQRKKW